MKNVGGGPIYEIYVDMYFLLNFWMNVLILFLVRQMIKTYRTFYCLISAMIGALGTCGVMSVYILQEQKVFFLLAEFVLVVLKCFQKNLYS